MIRKVLINLVHVPLLVIHMVLMMRVIHWYKLEACALDSSILVIALALAGHILGFWLPGLLCTAFPYLGIGVKLQPKRYTDPFEGIALVIANCFIGLAIAIPVIINLLPSVYAPIPPAATIARDVLVFLMIEEFLFFHFHFLAHRSPFIYRHIHKLHHRFTSPTAFHVLYTHPIEHVMVNILPLLLGPVLMASHHVLAILWLAVGQLSSLVAHSGYLIPLIPTNPLHDFHHEHFTGNFGVLGFFDFLYGTLK